MKQRILIVEDNILLSRVIGEWLAKCGYENCERDGRAFRPQDAGRRGV